VILLDIPDARQRRHRQDIPGQDHSGTCAPSPRMIRRLIGHDIAGKKPDAVPPGMPNRPAVSSRHWP
jgi:hypothetical protein